MPTYPGTEVRKPRHALTKKLHAVCAKLDEKAEAEVTFKASFYPYRERTLSVKILRVWVVGSYARGAPSCGDLDLIVEMSNNRLPMRVANGVFLGKLPDVRAYGGTPEKNDTELVFSEAVLVWDGAIDWRTAIASIPENPHATRFARKTDAVPLRAEQHCLYLEEVEDLLERREAGELDWEFVPLEKLIPQEPSPSMKQALAYHAKTWQKLAPYLQGFVSAHDEKLGSVHAQDWQRYLRFRTSAVFFGSMRRLRDDLLNNPSLTTVGLMPLLSSRGPNGIWLIRRGAAHPLAKAFENLEAWALCTAAGVLKTRQEYTYFRSTLTTIHLDLFTHESEARAYADLLQSHADEPLEPRLISGPDLLAQLAGVDVVTTHSSGKRSKERRWVIGSAGNEVFRGALESGYALAEAIAKFKK